MSIKYIRFLLPLLLVFIISNTACADTYSDHVMQGNFFYKNKDYKGAVKAYRNAVEADSSKTDVHYNLGLAYRQTKDYPSAVDSLELFLKSATEKTSRKTSKTAKKLIKVMAEALAKPTTSGKLKHSEVWEGWMLIKGDVIVPKGLSLTIKPGSLIMFTPLSSIYDGKSPFLDVSETDHYASLIIRGTLISEGKKEDEILFSNSFEDIAAKRIGLWGGIIFDHSIGSVLKYSKIERARNGVTVKSVQGLEFSNNIFVRNEVSVKLLDKPSITVDESIFYRNEIGVEFNGFSESKIIHSNFTKNNYAVKALDNSWPRITDNTFNNNSCGVCTYGDTFSTMLNNSFRKGTFGISMTGRSKANIKNNTFKETKVGVNSVGNSKPRIEKNTFTLNEKSAVETAGNSKASIKGNTFKDNRIAITKARHVKLSDNTFEDNRTDIKDIYFENRSDIEDLE